MTINTEDLAAGIMGMSGQPYEVMLYRATKAIDTAIAAAVLAETTRCAKVASAAIGHIVLTTMTLAEMNELCADKAYRAIMGEVTK